jgi:hypothetical protein
MKTAAKIEKFYFKTVRDFRICGAMACLDHRAKKYF